jgi:hypothetical protein
MSAVGQSKVVVTLGKVVTGQSPLYIVRQIERRGRGQIHLQFTQVLTVVALFEHAG